ncbi:MAG: Mevalonate kinase [Candidatus Alkanophagales archaeon MCA70_species_2]|nr:Mevalonate kinase [Candidatus Alkanophaga liquidiphilum]
MSGGVARGMKGGAKSVRGGARRSVRASAPAKTILFGEHAVVYGETALATAIEKRAFAVATPRGEPGYLINARDVPSFGMKVLIKDDSYASEAQGREGLKYVEECVSIFREHCNAHCNGVELEIFSEILPSAGLGSSAAVCVAVLAALFSCSCLEISLDELRALAHEVEKRVQGAASPTDTAISTFGGFVVIRNGNVEKLSLKPFELLIGCVSCVPHGVAGNLSFKTKELVEGVRRRKEEFKVFDKIFEVVGEISEEAVKALRKNDFKSVGELMNVNHGLLDAMGVVPRRLANIAKAAQENGALGAKVTGAGSSEAFGGVGCVIALPPQGDEAAKFRIAAVMRAAGATSVFSTKAGAEGVKLEGKNVESV